jgi:hypothetical protein
MYVIIALVSNISLVYSMILFAVLVTLSIFFIKNEVKQNEKSDRRRFLPIPIVKESLNLLQHCVSAIPFTIAAIILLFSSLFMNNLGSTFEADQSRLVTKADFEEHVRFQERFSFIPLGTSAEDAIDHHQYKNYELGDDGLVFDAKTPYADISNNRGLSNQALQETFIFSLEDLINHMQGTQGNSMRWLSLETIIPVVFFLFLMIFTFYAGIKQRGRKKTISMYNDKRIAA